MSRFISYCRSAPDFFPPNKKSHRTGLYGGKPKLLYMGCARLLVPPEYYWKYTVDIAEARTYIILLTMV